MSNCRAAWYVSIWWIIGSISVHLSSATYQNQGKSSCKSAASVSSDTVGVWRRRKRRRRSPWLASSSSSSTSFSSSLFLSDSQSSQTHKHSQHTEVYEHRSIHAHIQIRVHPHELLIQLHSGMYDWQYLRQPVCARGVAESWVSF